jgi:uridine phosphorylase
MGTKLKTRKPTGIVPWPLILIEGDEGAVSIGGAGGLCVGQVPGDVVVCDRAVRDEGVSHHYLESDRQPPTTSASGRQR